MPTDARHWDQLEPIGRASLPEVIAQRLTTLILEAGLKAGDRMPSERELMQRLSVGRSSLREAVKTLSALGVVRVAGGDGMYVGDGHGLLTRPVDWGLLLGSHDIEEVIEARRAVEVEMAGLAAERRTGEDLARLGLQLERMASLLHSPVEFTQVDAGFHLTVARAARNTVLAHVLETLHQIVKVWILRTVTEDTYQEHLAIYDAIARGDGAGARKAMGEHLDAAAARLKRTLTRPSGAKPTTRRRRSSSPRPVTREGADG